MKPVLNQIPDRKTITFPPWRDDAPRWWKLDHVVGAFAMWAVRQSPYDVPDELRENCVLLGEQLKGRISEAFSDEDRMGLLDEFWFRASHDWIHDALLELFEKIPGIRRWNERKNGSRSPLGFSDRYSRPDSDDDFIDLHALARNVSHTLIAETLIDED
jgi:hypothetical protein